MATEDNAATIIRTYVCGVSTTTPPVIGTSLGMCNCHDENTIFFESIYDLKGKVPHRTGTVPSIHKQKAFGISTIFSIASSTATAKRCAAFSLRSWYQSADFLAHQ